MSKFFIHIPKNGGMSLRHNPWFKKNVRIATADAHISKDYTRNLHATMAASGDHHGNEHARYRDIRPDIRENYEFFAAVRNPWSRVVSRYWFARKVIYVEKKQSPAYANVDSFESFLAERHKWGGKRFFWHRAVRCWYNAFDHVCDDDGNIACDILRTEYLDTEAPRYLGQPEWTRRRNVTAMMDGRYQDMYTPKTIQIVADWYQKDIETFGFDFDTPATKNVVFE